ncbi:MAG: type II toxin-antitoxin system RelE/ParE family toxin [Ostreibacterium sp.]
MFTIHTTDTFDKWLKKLRDRQAVFSIADRLTRIEALGQFGDCKQLSVNLWEMRFFIGKGYRIYYTIRNNQVVLLVCGGDKSNKKAQSTMIKTAQKMIDDLED